MKYVFSLGFSGQISIINRGDILASTPLDNWLRLSMQRELQMAHLPMTTGTLTALVQNIFPRQQGASDGV